MLTIQPDNGLEKHLCDRAFATSTPISGSFELLPVCNMNCRMCYVRMSQQEMLQMGKPLSANEWLRIGEEAVKQGAMFILLTGGEPLLHVDFIEIYLGLRSLGLCLTINTNGTLITPHLVEVLKNDVPRRVNVSLYGTSNTVYADLCRNPQGFTQVMKGIKLLRDADIPVKLNYTLTPQNRKEWDAISTISDELGIPVSTPTYMFPPARKPNFGSIPLNRMTPQQVAETQLEILYKNFHSCEDYKENLQGILDGINELERNSCPEIQVPGGYLCSAGVSSFWVNWKGELTPCGMLQLPAKNLLECNFEEAWSYIKEESRKVFTSNKCFHCKYRCICQNCAASALAETGTSAGEPSYHCETCKEYERLIKEELKTLKDENQ